MKLKSLILLISTLSLISTSAMAALAPNFQRAKEFSAVIAAVAGELPTHPITKVIYQNPDQYLVVAGPCTVRVSLKTKAMQDGMVGPRQFSVSLNNIRCKK